MFDYFYNKFKGRIAPDQLTPSTLGDWSDLFTNRDLLSTEQLTAPFAVDEIKRTTFQLSGEKALDPDGYILFFFQKFWDVIKPDLIKISNDLFDGVLNTGAIDYSHICLVPKKDGAKTANDFRSICLINSVQKIISKVLANRLEREMHKIISPSQTAFLKGRNIMDSFVTASEVFSWRSKSHIECVGIKADFEKTFDRVN